MFTFEDMTASFLQAAKTNGLSAHPEYWSNTRTLEREFACTCHTGSCEDVQNRSSCVLSYTWGALDTVISLEGPVGICSFFHEAPRDDCPHLHLAEIPPLVLDLSYSLALNGVLPTEEKLLSLMQLLKLRASENSQRTLEARPSVSMVLQENHLQPDTLSLQQHVELPIWHPLGMEGLFKEESYPFGMHPSDLRIDGFDPVTGELHEPDMPRPEDWAPQVLVEVCEDIVHVLQALDASIAYRLS